jgi:multidrug resistance efflux pump
METIKKETKEQRKDKRTPMESGSTVIIQCGGHEVVGTLEDRSDGGLGLRVDKAAKPFFSHDKNITVTYSMSYGLISQSAEIAWIKSGDDGELRVGTTFVQNDQGAQTGFQKKWKQFTDADSLEIAAPIWLTLQCAMLSGVTRSVLVLGKPDSGTYSPISFWPEGHRGSLGLTEAVELALHERRGVLRNQGQKDPNLNIPVCQIGYPLMLDSQLYGVVAIEMAVRAEHLMRASIRQLQWGAAWLELFIRREEGKKYSPENRQLATVLELIAVGLEQERFQASATALATELASLLKCERVSIGFVEGKYIQVRALSHSINFAKKSNLIQSIGLAMDEAMEQMITLVYPPPDQNSVQILRCHEKLARDEGSGSICTIPFCSNGEVFGALSLERPPGKGFERQTLDLCETIASLIGPILEAKRKEDLWLIQRAWLSAKEFYKRLIGPAHGGLKVATIAVVAVLLFFTFAKGDYRIAADTYLEGSIQRVIVAPFDGYISESYVRPGDTVKEGMLLAKLDDNDLMLERVKLESQREQYLKEYRDALGQAERSKISILKAQLGQVEAQLSITDAQLSRINIKAPFDGVIVSGDLSQKLGAPSERGDVLFEIAPSEAYRVILEVDERDISDVRIDQGGELVLTGHSETVMPFKVRKVTPVSEAKEGRNYFRVEAELEKKLDFLRPGIKGVGKIQAGKRKLIWIWTKNLTDWLRLTLWTWWPEGL